MFIPGDAIKLYGLSELHARMYRAAHYNLSLFCSPENIKWGKNQLANALTSLETQWSPIMRTAVEEMLQPAYIQTGNHLFYSDIKGFFVTYYERHHPHISQDDVVAQWEAQEDFQHNCFVTAVSLEHQRLFPFIHKYKNLQVPHPGSSCLASDYDPCWTEEYMAALNEYACSTAQVAHHSSIAMLEDFNQIHDILTNAPGQVPNIFGNPFQVRYAWEVVLCAWYYTKLGLTLPTFTYNGFSTFDDHAIKLRATFRQLCAARGVKDFAPVNSPPLTPHGCRNLLRPGMCGRDPTDLLLQMRHVAETATRSSRLSESPAEFTELPNIPFDDLAPILTLLADRLCAPPQTPAQQLSSAISSLSFNADPWTEDLPISNDTLSKLAEDARDEYLGNGIEKFLEGQPHELRLAVWNMRIGVRPWYFMERPLVIPKCDALNVHPSELTMGETWNNIFEALEMAARCPLDCDELLRIASYLRGLSQARGVPGV